MFTLDQLRAQWGTLHMKVFIGIMAVLLVALHAGILYVKVLVYASGSVFLVCHMLPFRRLQH